MYPDTSNPAIVWYNGEWVYCYGDECVSDEEIMVDLWSNFPPTDRPTDDETCCAQNEERRTEHQRLTEG